MVSEKTVSSKQVEGNLLFLDVPSHLTFVTGKRV